MYYKELANMIMEAKKANICSYPVGHPRRTGGIITAEFKSLRTRRTNGIRPSVSSNSKTED